MTSDVTPITTASSSRGESSATGEHQPAGHSLSALRGVEAKALISLGKEALGEAGNLGSELHSLIYRDNARIRDHRLADKLAEMVACVQTAEHYLLMLGSIVGEAPQRGPADNSAASPQR